ncbi:MAG: hypothetical protein PHN75_10225 [Syntrophales bacterium]|nr:hypothetical protein [Syntrophales bacterium]
MTRLDSILLKIFLYGFPAVAVLAVSLQFFHPKIGSHSVGYLKLLNNFSGFVFAFWLLCSLYLSIRLLFSETFRDKVLTKLTFIRERDEREAILTGKATRATFLSSLAILIFLFCLSTIHVSMYRVPPEKAVDGKTGFVSLGVGFSLFENGEKTQAVTGLQKKDIFSYTNLPLSNTAVILLLILWQIASYNYSMWRSCGRGIVLR